ncbi:hypothetical protein B0J13DRAFT_204473 [Dactylonectria estremocensis]|uniref:NB-ARC domain-containing protein n=1 Tax=Dactylonectria estremocensis TaxID=1079267 RepID=A0A9P9ICL5_9HYPO|nr:hypothetical protein B0J13DRAFT_204473 [Dactylonectria estremocensis]
MSHTSFQGPLSGEYVIAGAHASGGGTINFNFGDHAPQQSIRPFSTIPFPPDPKFVERTDILLWLRDHTVQPGSRAALVGLGGIGSRFITRTKSDRHHRIPGFSGCMRAPAPVSKRRTETSPINCSFRDLCDEENGPWMMVLDNADSVDVFFTGAHGSHDQPLASFLPKTGRGSIIITSRNTDAAERLAGLDAIYNVPIMEKSQALQLLQNRLGECAEDDAIITDLDDDLNYMPLAITQAATYIKRRRPRMSVSAYVDEFRRSHKKKASLLNRDGGDLRRDESASNSIVTTWQITFEQIRRDRPSAADLLSFMSFFNPQGIPEFALQTYVRKDGEDGEEDLPALGISLLLVKEMHFAVVKKRSLLLVKRSLLLVKSPCPYGVLL